jgi:hypothetical protein
MTAPFASPQEAARALIVWGYPLNRRSGQFVGGIAFDAIPLTEKQANWLAILTKKQDLDGDENGDRHG